MASNQPLLNPHARGWRRDLPGPNDRPDVAPGLFMSAPNRVDDVYLELPRSYLDMRGLLTWLTPAVLAACGWALFGIFSDAENLPIGFLLVAVFLLLLSVWGGLMWIRMDICPPRDLPLRFNRVRRKVYAYEFKAIWWNPFVRWPVRAAAYDWDDVRAEAWSQGGMAGSGVYCSKSGVVVSVVRPGTNEVIDRFQLRAKANDEKAWAYICTYMQQGPQALPPSKWKPRDWNNEPTINLARLLAPKVKWPEEMDIESRTAPSPHHATCPSSGSIRM
ncbi:DUF6708 domain-containing protein [Paraburkholderia diazotrophica]|uniref:DUF6708 domain-containing protein n=1 Tax=Paraburkholderia diazotrophica TaxID=667676 RepID=UPI003178A96F